ncbi:nifU-like protein 1, chloroplastic [Coffea eugenioides]|uniref:NifU-like protein 1, chloroplastic n=1 Tax=Coffea arabica TaxID=13443 RepID=A0A6P6V9R1_COFAR|nr:nifU-like protein 1, chloroplastic [Coffea arabica]XP_027183125.1 nifU-like protein 1, chloroplastic [Coffea eugenioides]
MNMAAAAAAASSCTTTNLLVPPFQVPSHRRLPNISYHFSFSSSNSTSTSTPPPLPFSITATDNTKKKKKKTTRRMKMSSSASGSQGLYSAADQFELTPENVDLVLQDVRPYLIADGGNVDVVSVQNGIVSLKLQGACGSCPSSTTTMKLGIERVLKEKFGDAIKEICQVYDEQIDETTIEAVDGHLDILRPAIKNYGGSIQVLSVEGGDCVVKYAGPESIGLGIKAAIREKFPDIANVVLTD